MVPICIETYHQQQLSVAPLSIFTIRSIAEKRITGNEKNFWNCLDVLKTWEGQNIFSVKWQKKQNKTKQNKKTKKQKQKKNKKKKKKKNRLILIKKAELKKKKTVKDNENLQDMCKNHQGLPCNRKKKEFANYLWVTVITPNICQILQEKPYGKSKMVLFRLKK